MKSVIELWLLQRWYGDAPPGFTLRALSGVLRVVSMARARLQKRQSLRQTRLQVPVIVIGNFTVGGTGKTPLTIALATHLQSKGYRPAIISRGYGRTARHPVHVAEDTPVTDCGDEPKLIFERTGLPVFVDSDRVAAGHRAMEAGCNLIIADDGLQHHRLQRDIEIEVVDAARGYGNGLLLPAGPLREPPRQCDFRVVNGVSEKEGDVIMSLQLSDANSLVNPGVVRPLSYFSGLSVHAVAAIGNPKRFFSALRNSGLQFSEHPFSDHHQFSLSDFASMNGMVLMTEKDAVKCRHFNLPQAWVVPVDAQLPAKFLTDIEFKLHHCHD